MLTCVVFTACSSPDSNAPEPFEFDSPFGPIPSPERNPLTTAGVELGKALFFDTTLSVSGDVSCASCHQPKLYFSDAEPKSSDGVSGDPLIRHTPTLFNLAWHSNYFWDGGANDLESQAFGPLQHRDELGNNLQTVVETLAQHDIYSAQFEQAFGTQELTSALVVRALAQYQRTLVSAHSRYDRHIANEPGFELTPLEVQGLEIFEAKCASCHTPGFFTDFKFHNNGLDSVYSEAGLKEAWGRARITLDPNDMGAYKTPSLRNVMLTAPYMHDGRFESIDDVLDHYRNGVQMSDSLAPLLHGTNNQLGIRLTDDDAMALKHFLSALSDTSFSGIHTQ